MTEVLRTVYTCVLLSGAELTEVRIGGSIQPGTVLEVAREGQVVRIDLKAGELPEKTMFGCSWIEP